MKKASFVLAFVLAFSLSACKQDIVDMSNIDENLNKNDTLYIDLRSADEMVASGYIDGFTRIAYYESIVQRGILRQTTTWKFTSNDILNEEAFRNLFDESKTLYIMCRSGNRSSYIVAALKHLGYSDVHDIGGIIDYRGDNLVFPE